MIEISNLSMSLDSFLPENKGRVKREVAKALQLPQEAFRTVQVTKRSIDARRKKDIHAVVSVQVELDGDHEERLLAEAPQGLQVKRTEGYVPLELPVCEEPAVPPVVVGAGPAGLFAALYLARCGLKPLVVERGLDVDARAEKVEEFTVLGELDPNCNIQFGEGGAGTFSDGKLTTNVKNPLTKHVLQWFVEAGAPDEILWQAHPHLGSDNLPGIVRHMRWEIIQRGGEVRFGIRLTAFQMEAGKLRSVTLEDVATGETCEQPAQQLIVACGHSAHDVFELMRDEGFAMERKPFSVGVRIEHPQRLINQAQWGKATVHPALGAAEYKLAEHLESGRSVYTFCMCPGGEVVAAASEEGGVVTNGMSNFARDGRNANAAVLVNVEPTDFPGDDVLAGIEFQRGIEQAAFQAVLAAGGEAYQAPAQTFGAFRKSMHAAARAEREAAGIVVEQPDREVLAARREQEILAKQAAVPQTTIVEDGTEIRRGRKGNFDRSGHGNHYDPRKGKGKGQGKSHGPQAPKGPKPIGARELSPTYGRGVCEVPLMACLPDFVCKALLESIPLMGRKLKGFDDPKALLTAPETRSSSPVRIKRDEQLQVWFAPQLAEGEGEPAADDEALAAVDAAPADAFAADATDASAQITTGIYPCGEGPGYAGGIMSAAVDGIRVAARVAAAHVHPAE